MDTQPQIPETLKIKNYFDVGYDTNFPTSNYYVDTFSSIPSVYTFYEMYFKPKIIAEMSQQEGFAILFKREKFIEEGVVAGETLIMNPDKKIIISFFAGTTEDDEDEKMIVIKIYYHTKDNIDDLVQSLKTSKYRIANKGNIKLVKAGQYGLETVSFNIESEVNDLALCYGEEFIEVHNRIVESLNQPKSKGIVLLHGVPGSGKSYYIKHLSTLLKKKVLWLPQTAADNLCSPDFITFLMDNMNSVLIIEDGERTIKDREGNDGSASAVSNLLNLTDGILSDCLHIQVVATFNTDIKNIDKALLRKGRLIVDYQFGKLSVENTNKLLKEIGINYESTEEMTLADIYNYNQKDLSNNNKNTKKLGFRR